MEVDLWIWALILGLGASFPFAAGIAVYRSGASPRGAALTGVTMAVWLLAVLAIAGAGLLRAQEGAALPLIGPAVAIPVAAGILLSRSNRIGRVLAGIPQTWLLAAQAPRVLGIAFLVLYAQGKLPGHFALAAGIGDILVGVAGPAVAWFYARNPHRARPVAVGFNVVGLADLLLAVGTGFLSAPSPFRLFVTEPSTQLLTVLPLVLIPTFLLPTFVLVHLLSLRKLAAGSPARGRVGRAAIPGTG